MLADFHIQAVEHSLKFFEQITRKHTMATMGDPLALSVTRQDLYAKTYCYLFQEKS